MMKWMRGRKHCEGKRWDHSNTLCFHKIMKKNISVLLKSLTIMSPYSPSDIALQPLFIYHTFSLTPTHGKEELCITGRHLLNCMHASFIYLSSLKLLFTVRLSLYPIATNDFCFYTYWTIKMLIPLWHILYFSCLPSIVPVAKIKSQQKNKAWNWENYPSCFICAKCITWHQLAASERLQCFITEPQIYKNKGHLNWKELN